MIERTFITDENFFGYKETYPPKLVDMILSKDQCNAMVQYNLCDNKPMLCSGTECKYDFDPSLTYSWMTRKTFIVKHCLVQKVMISSKHSNSPVFKSTTSSCLPHDLFCVLGKYTFVWNRDILIDCPFQIVNQYELNKIGDLLIGSNLVFQLLQSQLVCGSLTISSTTEGLWIANAKDTTHLKKFTEDINSEKSLIFLFIFSLFIS